jgi:hypothetical protein
VDIFVFAEAWYFDAGYLSSLHDGGALRGLHVFAVNSKLYHV